MGVRYCRDRKRVWLIIGKRSARIHHGLVGSLLLVVALGLIAHDYKDFPWLDDRE
jgi:hypothetical protein